MVHYYHWLVCCLHSEGEMGLLRKRTQDGDLKTPYLRRGNGLLLSLADDKGTLDN